METGEYSGFYHGMTRTPEARAARRATHNLPCQLPFRPDLPDEKRAPELNKQHSRKEMKRVTKKYVMFQKDKSGEYFARWNPDFILDPHAIRKMLEWYTKNGVYQFPPVKSITPLGKGFTKMYFLVRFWPGYACGERSELPEKVILRFSLPVCPVTQLQHEISTMSWVSKLTDWVPKVLMFDPWGQNELHLEWLIMEVVQGFILQNCIDENVCTCETGLQGLKPVARKNPRLTAEKLMKIGNDVLNLFVRITDDFMHYPWLGSVVGSLKVNWVDSRFNRGELVCKPFYIREHLFKYEADAGPFYSFHDYLKEYFKAAYCELESDEQYYLNRKLDARLEAEDKNHMDYIVATRREIPWGGKVVDRPVTLNHTNLHAGNILVNENGDIVAIMGWEDAVVMPTAWQEAINKLDEMYQRCATDDLFKPMGSCCEPFRLGRPLMYPRHSLGYGHSCPECDGPSCFADPSDPHSSKSKTGPFKRMKRRLTNLL